MSDVCTCGSCDGLHASARLGPAASVRTLARRQFLAVGSLAAVGAVGFAPRIAWAQTAISPDEAIEKLMAGNARFVSGKLDSFKEDLDLLKQANAGGQQPFAAVLGCADSRVPVELVFDQSIGRLFVARVAGNIASSEVIASLEYGAAVLGVKAIMVLGHQGCGAVKAAVAGHAEPGQISALYAPLRPAVELSHGDAEVAGRANAKIQAALLASASPVLAGLIEEGKLRVVSAYYALDTGKVSLLT